MKPFFCGNIRVGGLSMALLALPSLTMAQSDVTREIAAPLELQQRYGPGARTVQVLEPDAVTGIVADNDRGDAGAGASLQFRDLAPSSLSPLPAEFVTITDVDTLNSAVAKLAELAHLGYVPSPYITEKVVATTRIPVSTALEMINTLLAPYGYRALISNQTVQVYGGNIDQHLGLAVLKYHINNLSFVAGHASHTGQTEDTGDELAAKNVSAFFRRIASPVLSSRGTIEYDPIGRNVEAHDLSPYLEMMRQYLVAIDVPQQVIMTNVRMFTVTPRGNAQIEHRELWAACDAAVRASGVPADSAGITTENVFDAAAAVLSAGAPTGAAIRGIEVTAKPVLNALETAAALQVLRRYAEVDLQGSQEFINLDQTHASFAINRDAAAGQAIDILPEVLSDGLVSLRISLEASKNKPSPGNAPRNEKSPRALAVDGTVLKSNLQLRTGSSAWMFGFAGQLGMIAPQRRSQEQQVGRANTLIVISPQIVEATNTTAVQAYSDSLYLTLRTRPVSISPATAQAKGYAVGHLDFAAPPQRAPAATRSAAAQSGDMLVPPDDSEKSGSQYSLVR